MSNLMDIIQGQLGGVALDRLSKEVGGNPLQTATAANSIVNALLGGLSKNAASESGASALVSALDRDHDGSILDDAMELIGGMAGGGSGNRALNGAGILGHVLGGRQSNMVEMISKLSGLDKSKTGRLAIMLAPLVMGALGKAKKQSNLNQGGIADLLRGTVQTQSKGNAQMDMLSRVLDADGDGSVVDDVAGMGMKILGGLFGKRR